MPLQIDQQQYWRLGEVAKVVGVCRQTLWRWRLDSLIPPGKKYRERQVLYSAAEVEAIKRHANRLESFEMVIAPKKG